VPDTGRARPLPPDERRAMLIAATLPLVLEHGPKVTTKQIAQAAGVAEGTIFRVFPDKEALVKAAVAEAMDPLPTIAALSGVDESLPLPERLRELTEIMQERLIAVFRLMMAIGLQGPPKDMEEQRRRSEPANARILEEVLRLLEPDRDRFRVPLTEVARMLRLLTFAGSHPLITENQFLTADEIVGVLLNGLLTGPTQPSDRGQDPC
jgi:AcrR family transcriptional regulator